MKLSARAEASLRSNDRSPSYTVGDSNPTTDESSTDLFSSMLEDAHAILLGSEGLEESTESESTQFRGRTKKRSRSNGASGPFWDTDRIASESSTTSQVSQNGAEEGPGEGFVGRVDDVAVHHGAGNSTETRESNNLANALLL